MANYHYGNVTTHKFTAD